jgi:hypothetical protein
MYSDKIKKQEELDKDNFLRRNNRKRYINNILSKKNRMFSI